MGRAQALNTHHLPYPGSEEPDPFLGQADPETGQQNIYIYFCIFQPGVSLTHLLVILIQTSVHNDQKKVSRRFHKILPKLKT